MNLKREIIFGYLNLIITVVFFSTYEVVNKNISKYVNLYQINFIRFFVGGLILMLFLIGKDMRISKKSLILTTIAGILNVGISMNLLLAALMCEGSKASVVAVIFSSNPIFVALFSQIIEKEKIGIWKAVGYIIGIVGVLTISLNKLNFNEFLNNKYTLLAVLSAIVYGLYTVVGRVVSKETGSIKMNAYSFLIGSLILIPFIKFDNISIVYLNNKILIQTIYLSICVTGIAYWCYFKGLVVLGSTKGSLVFFLKPILATIIAIIVLNESITMNFIFGTFLILISLMLILEIKIKKTSSKV